MPFGPCEPHLQAGGDDVVAILVGDEAVQQGPRLVLVASVCEQARPEGVQLRRGCWALGVLVPDHLLDHMAAVLVKAEPAYVRKQFVEGDLPAKRRATTDFSP